MIRFLAIALLLALTLTDCGRRGAPSPPGPGADITYPRVYPAPN
jgi:predicted small lipoprotein YifL